MSWTFDANQHDPSGNGNFPLGTHTVAVVSAASEAAKTGNGGKLVLQLRVVEGPLSGFVGPYNINLWNTNPQAADIAHRQLSAICHVTGRYQLSSMACAELVGIPFKIIVTPQDDPKYTQISGVLDIGGNPAVKGQMPSQAAPAQHQAPPAAQAAPQQAPPAWQGQQPAPAAAPQAAPAAWAPQGQPAAQPAPAQPPQGGAPAWAAQPPGAAPAWAGPPR